MMTDAITTRPVLKQEYQEIFADIYSQYQYTVKPYVAQLEVMENEFPVEILNEVRAIMGHLAKCYETTNEESVKKTLQRPKAI